MSTSKMQGSGHKEKHQNSNSKAKGPGSSSSTATTVNNNFTSYGNNYNATSVQTPRKPVGYTFNNGQEKQPILRAQEYEPDDSFSDDGASVAPSVGLNFNFWMEHSYIVDQQISNIITEFIRPDRAQKKSARSNAVARGALVDIENIVILSVQDVDPRELNDNIYTLPFLSSVSTMPIRHVSETTPSAASFDESVFANASGEQMWQYLDVAPQNAMMLWTERPTVSLNSLVGVSTIELLTKYSLTFMGIHTQWQDEVVFYSDAHPVTLVNNPTTVAAFQEMARQKLVGCKDAPAYMLQLFCDLTKPPMPGDVFGRCSKAHAKETGMFLYRPAPTAIPTTATTTTPSTATPPTATKARFLVLWFRAKEIDVLEEAPSVEATHNKLNVYAPTDPTEHTRTFAKVVPPVAVGKGRFQETMDFVMTLRKAVLRAQPAGFGGIESGKESNGSGVSDSVGSAACSGDGDGDITMGSSEAAVVQETTSSTALTTTVIADNTTITTATTTTTNTHEYFNHTLQTQLRSQFASSAFKTSLHNLVLSQPMQILMGYIVNRSDGYEDFIDTSESGFYGNLDEKCALLGNSETIKSVVMTSKVDVKVKEKEELEDGECEESDVSVAGDVITSQQNNSAEKLRVNKKIYFTDDGGTIADPTVNSTKNSDKHSDSGDSSDAEDNMAVLLANNARKRKAHLLAQQEDGEEVETEHLLTTIGEPEVQNNTNTNTGNNTNTNLNKKSKTVQPPPPAPTNISDLINMYTPTALKAPTTTTSNNGATVRNSSDGVSGGVKSVAVNNGATPNKSGAKPPKPPQPPLPPLPPPSTTINTAITTITTSIDTTVTTPIEPYQCTLIPLHTIKTPLEMIALDCEMCSTPIGLELTRLTVLCPVNGVVYDTLVRPELDITDYHTEFSGITENQLANVTTTLKEVQDTLRQLISDRTIIVGHSADTDLKVLQLVHGRVIDTSALFPHPTGLPYKHSLKKLAKDYLCKDIQDGKEGHDSVQDAAIALELAFLKARQGENGSFICPWLDDPVPKCSIFEPLLSYESPAGSSMSVPVSSPQPVLSVSVHGIPSALGYGTPVWEDFAFGYRPEGDSCLNVEHCRAALQAQLTNLKAAMATQYTTMEVSDGEADRTRVRQECDRLEAQIEQLRHQRHGTTEEAFTHALQDLSTLSSRPTHHNSSSNDDLHCRSSSDSGADDSSSALSTVPMQKSLTIVEMCCNDEIDHDAGDKEDTQSMHSAPNDPYDDAYMTVDQEYSGGEDSGAEGKEGGDSFLRGPRRALTGLARIDHYAQQLMQAAPVNTLMLVVTQGNFKAMKQLASKKLRNRWEQAALKRKQSLVGLGRVSWDAYLDESRLVAAAAHATAGTVFLAKK